MNKVPMIVLTVGIATAVGGLTWLFSGGEPSQPRVGSSFGGSRASPLGLFESMDERLVGLGLKKEKRSSAPTAIRRKKMQKGPVFCYLELDKASADNKRYDATVAADIDGVVYGVHAAFWSGSKEATSSCKVATFARKLWREVTGGEPKFEEVKQGSGVSEQSFLVASFESAGIRGTWRKRFLREGVVDSIVDEMSFSMK